jgi:hypothetical protein
MKNLIIDGAAGISFDKILPKQVAGLLTENNLRM